MTTLAPLQPTAAHKPEYTGSLYQQSTQEEAVVKNGNTPVPRGPVTAQLHFYQGPEDGSKPYNWVEQPPEGQPQRNYSDTIHDVTLHDIRGRESDFTTDANAFAAYTVPPSAETAFTDDEHIKRVYYPEVEQLLLSKLPGAHRIILFDHTIRRASPAAHRGPVTRVHVDQTAASTIARVRLHAPDDADALLAGRYRIVNVWRPLNGPVVSFPLAFADSATVRDEDLIGVEHRYPTRTGETAAVEFNEAQKWYYWSGIGNNERIFLKCFDSDEALGKKGRAPHTAFVDPRTPEGAVGRESIEVRALVFG